MARKGDMAAAAVVRRIRESENELEIHFPPTRPVTGASGPEARPASPLTGPRPAPSLVASDPVGEADPLVLHCLWLDAPLSERSLGGLQSAREVGWVDGADALARVAWADAVVDPDAPHKGTHFDRALYVLFRGLRWRVLKTEPMGASFRKPHSLSVWLAGANKQ